MSTEVDRRTRQNSPLLFKILDYHRENALLNYGIDNLNLSGAILTSFLCIDGATFYSLCFNSKPSELDGTKEVISAKSDEEIEELLQKCSPNTESEIQATAIAFYTNNVFESKFGISQTCEPAMREFISALTNIQEKDLIAWRKNNGHAVNTNKTNSPNIFHS